MLYTQVKELFTNELLLTQMEKCALMEALVLISNQFKDYSKQKAFLEELMASVTARWLSEEMCRYRSSWRLLLKGLCVQIGDLIMALLIIQLWSVGLF